MTDQETRELNASAITPEGLYDEMLDAFTNARGQEQITWVTDATGTRVAAIVPVEVAEHELGLRAHREYLDSLPAALAETRALFPEEEDLECPDCPATPGEKCMHAKAWRRKDLARPHKGRTAAWRARGGE